MLETRATQMRFETSDGVTLSFLEAGAGPPLVLLHGWSQAAALWHAQIDAFSATHRVLALDMRGHGGSQTPDHGYRIARLSQDLHELMLARDLRDATLVGHSMGCSVILNLWDLHGADRIARLVLFDEGARLCDDGLSTCERTLFGAGLPAAGWFETASALAGPEGEEMTATMLAAMFSAAADKAMVKAVVARNLAFARRHAARLLVSNVTQDWRDVYGRITVPTLVIGAGGGAFPPDAMRWQATQIPGARYAEIGADEGGSHFAFLENPARFNEILAAFFAACPVAQGG